MKIPSSLKWLIDKRARLLGEIAQVEKATPESQLKLSKKIAHAEFQLIRLQHQLATLRTQQIQARNRPQYLEVLRADMAAIDRALEQHDIQINPELIKPIRSQWAEKFLAHGEITRKIYTCLKAGYPEPQTTTEVTVFILSATEMQLNPNEFMEFKLRVSRRLSHLAWEKKILRLHEVKTCQEGQWTLLLPSHRPESRKRTESLPAD